MLPAWPVVDARDGIETGQQSERSRRRERIPNRPRGRFGERSGHDQLRYRSIGGGWSANWSVALVPMPRTPNTRHDVKITSMIEKGDSVAKTAAHVGVSEPTVYNTLKRLDVSLPSKRQASPASGGRKAPATKPTAPSPAPVKARATKRTVKETPATTPVAAAPPRQRQRPRKRSATPASAVASVVETAPTALVPVAANVELLTERVDKGIELLRNLSAQIVRRERELASARARYAETLASLALD